MRLFSLVLGILISSAPIGAAAWKEVFRDDFDGTSVNAAEWSMYHSPGHNGNGLRRASAFSVANGILTCTARMVNGQLVSGGMAHHRNYLYGKFEFRVRTTPESGTSTSGVVLTWPQSEQWPRDGENDIYETTTNRDRKSFHTFIHYPDAQGRDATWHRQHQVDASQWRTVAMEWEPGQIRIYHKEENAPFRGDEQPAAILSDPAMIPDNPHHLCIQLDAFAQTMTGESRLEVDWVRIYQWEQPAIAPDPASGSLLPAPPAGKTWKMVWNDEFDGQVIDGTKWDRPNWPRRDHFWRANSAFLDGQGHMVLRTEKIDGKYYSPCIRTIDRFYKAYGYFETRAKLPREEGHWTAFWLYHPDVNKVGNEGRDGTEIDIFEWPHRDGSVHHALHWDGYGAAHKNTSKTSHPPGILDGGFHVFSLWWTPEEYVFYVDGRETWRTSDGGVCQIPLYLKWSSEIGDWAGDITKAELPDDTVIDYVRVFDLVDVPSTSFNIRTFNRRNNQIHLSFQTQPGKLYTIFSSPDLSTWSAVPLQQSLRGSGGIFARSFPDPGGQRHFFRIDEF
ncbi:glycoside hydrolase family 16 protein [Luteolibacter flavescens]|uniref:Glycoside hydrolase family 16 protein n=1 Tax=Luteolibacter flavescens TaxID=1859460 RepID=A0ABT3FVE8_9BACT|nr:glycoside hydrolase family 16 protein [Luteolibacter flavescens]MCW1887543.1 glycoside hydrolase family 16 protein [Luteolibacter flavescens]